eukprot:5254348-Prorocentrum_lima.AAC.1
MAGGMYALAAYRRKRLRASFFGLSPLYVAGCPIRFGFAEGNYLPSATGPVHARSSYNPARPF